MFNKRLAWTYVFVENEYSNIFVKKLGLGQRGLFFYNEVREICSVLENVKLDYLVAQCLLHRNYKRFFEREEAATLIAKTYKMHLQMRCFQKMKQWVMECFARKVQHMSETICAMCFESFVGRHVLICVANGESFCESCVNRTRRVCPSCRVNEGWVRNHALENLIHELVNTLLRTS